MKFKSCRLILLTGEKHSGKTTFLKKVAAKLKKENFRIAGFLAPSIYEGAFLSGFDIVDINNGRRVKLARRKSLDEAFQFSEHGLKFGRKILKSKETRNADLIIIDEFGPLELQGGGWRECVDSLLKSVKSLILLVVRKESAEEVSRLYSHKHPIVLPASDSLSADNKQFRKLINELQKKQKLLKKK